jgi:hypothetical protein
VEMKEVSTDHEDRCFQITCKACRDISYRLTNGQLHEAGNPRVCFIGLNSEEHVMFDDRFDC